MSCAKHTRKGLRCSLKAGPSGFCLVHDPSQWRDAPTASEHRCTVPTDDKSKGRKTSTEAQVTVDPNASVTAKSLAAFLHTVQFKGERSPEVTHTLGVLVTKWGQQQGLRVVNEVPAPAAARNDRRGFLDFVCFDRSSPLVAVEIDRSNKQWSQQKLAAVSARGVTALWLRWGNKILSEGLADGVELVQLPLYRRRSRETDSGWHSSPLE